MNKNKLLLLSIVLAVFVISLISSIAVVSVMAVSPKDFDEKFAGLSESVNQAVANAAAGQDNLNAAIANMPLTISNLVNEQTKSVVDQINAQLNNYGQTIAGIVNAAINPLTDAVNQTNNKVAALENKNAELVQEYQNLNARIAALEAQPLGITWRGSWSTSTTYAINDCVSYGGGSYICIKSHSNITPPNSTYWGILAQGDDYDYEEDSILIGLESGSITGSLGGDTVVFCRYTCLNTGYASYLRVRCTADGYIRAAIYSESSGKPNNLLSANNDDNEVEAGWNAIPITSTYLTKGTLYWLAMVSSVTTVAYSGTTYPTQRFAADYDTYSFPASINGTTLISGKHNLLISGVE